MNERNHRMATSAEPPATGAAPHAVGPYSWDDVELPAAEERAVDEILELFRDAIDRVVAERLDGDEAVQSRLARVRRASQEAEGALELDFDDELVSYGHTVVTLWVRLLLADQHCPVGMTESDLDEIAKETVARALNTTDVSLPSDEVRRKVAFLVRCVDHLPPAYERWRLGTSVLDVDELEETALLGARLIGGLRLRMSDPRGTARLIQKWAPAKDVDDIIAYTQGALHRHGELP